MPQKIHDSAIINPDAVIAADVEVGAFTIIEDGVTIGKGSIIHSHVHLLGEVAIGENCEIWPGAVIGGDPQSVDFDSRVSSGIVIGNNNTLRENVTIHRSMNEGEKTVIGDENFLMANAHIGHDSIIGDNNVIANNTMFGGHVLMGNRCFLGGGTAIHQFARIGDLVISQGNSATSLDIPPYLIVSSVNYISGLNAIGMRRAGFDAATRREIKRAYLLFYQQGLNRQQALDMADKESWGNEAQVFINFLRQKSKLGYCLRTK